MAFFEISTTKYEENIKLLQVSMTKLAALCNITSGFRFGEPVSRIGWTFFHMLSDQALYVGSDASLPNMIKNCKGNQ